MIEPSEIIFALKEEIGNSNIFTGRKKDIEYFLKWVEGVREELNISIAILARRKKGKTALVQRLYNILFTINDPMIIPFYYKVREEDKSQLKLADEFYHSLLCQYAAFKTRDISFMRRPIPYLQLKEIFKEDIYLVDDIKYMEMCIKEANGDKAWSHAAYAGERISILKNERIIQILDEFQYLDQYIYNGDQYIREYHLPLCGTYHHVGASKISPVIVTGSYVTWLLSIINKMTGRYKAKILKNLPLEEAMEAVYAYSSIYKIPVTKETAAYIATVTDGDVYYIASLFESDYEDKDLTDLDCIDEIILYETRTTEKENGEIARMWFEYLYDATSKVNDKNGKQIILYLAKQGKNERTRKEIREDLNLDMTETELEKKLDTLIQADILSYGQTRYDYKGLGDKMFEIVFKGMYQKEIDSMDIEEIRSDIKKELRSLRGKANFYKGMMTEYAVINKLLFAMIKGQPLKELVHTYIEGYELTECSSVMKKRFSINQTKFIEVDIYMQSKTEAGNDFIMEVKNWKMPVTKEQIEKFISTKNILQNIVKPNTGYIFYSQNPLTAEYEELLKQNGIMSMYGE